MWNLSSWAGVGHVESVKPTTALFVDAVNALVRKTSTSYLVGDGDEVGDCDTFATPHVPSFWETESLIDTFEQVPLETCFAAFTIFSILEA